MFLLITDKTYIELHDEKKVFADLCDMRGPKRGTEVFSLKKASHKFWRIDNRQTF